MRIGMPNDNRTGVGSMPGLFFAIQGGRCAGLNRKSKALPHPAQYGEENHDTGKKEKKGDPSR